MPRADLRTQLKAIAKGEVVPPPAGAPIIDGAFVRAEQEAFAAWHGLTQSSRRDFFSQDEGHGEVLTAPAEILVPLP